MLKRLGMTPTRIKEEDLKPDSLSFYQLTLPIHNIDNNKVMTVPNDPRKPFYSNVARWSNLYACDELDILGGGDTGMNSKRHHQWSVYNGMDRLLWTAFLVEAKGFFYGDSTHGKATKCTVPMLPRLLQRLGG